MLSLFPALSTSGPKLSWKDEHDDFVSFSSDSELRDAIESKPTNKSAIDVYVKVSNFLQTIGFCQFWRQRQRKHLHLQVYYSGFSCRRITS